MNPDALPASRLSTLQAAWVVARRDFRAVLFSRTFIFFLLGPLFPVAVGSLAGSIGGKVEAVAQANTVALAMAPADNRAMLAAADAVGPKLASSIPDLAPVAAGDPRAILADKAAHGSGAYAAVVTGTPRAPKLTGPQGEIDRWSGPVALLAAQASGEGKIAFATLSTEQVQQTVAVAHTERIRTAQAARPLLSPLAEALAGMVR